MSNVIELNKHRRKKISRLTDVNKVGILRPTTVKVIFPSDIIQEKLDMLLGQELIEDEGVVRDFE